MQRFHVYVLRLQERKFDGSIQYYVGMSGNLMQRLASHVRRTGAKPTYRYGVHSLVYVREYPTRSHALGAESLLAHQVAMGDVGDSLFSSEQCCYILPLELDRVYPQR